MNKKEFIGKLSALLPTIVYDELKADLEIVIKQELLKTHIFIDNNAIPKICEQCEKSIEKSMSKRKYCPICNQFYLF